MASPYDFLQDPSQRFQLPESTRKVLPKGLGEDFLQNLDANLMLQEKKATENLLGSQEEKGFLQSGQTTKKLVEDILGPGLQRRQEALLPLAMSAAETGQRQDYETTFEKMQFEQKRQFAQEEFNRKLQFLREEASMNEELQRLQADLSSDFGRNFNKSLGQSLGSAPTELAKAYLAAGA